jgi:hypothetical protein
MIRRHLTYANVMSTIAVFVVMGGSAYALSKHSVGTKQLKNKAVTTKKIKNGAVTGAKIAAGALPSAALNVTAHSAPAPTIAATAVGGGTANCPAGKKAIGGGGLSDASTNGAQIEDSRPVNGSSGAVSQDGTFNGWRVIWHNTNAGGGPSVNPLVYVVCLG